MHLPNEKPFCDTKNALQATADREKCEYQRIACVQGGRMTVTSGSSLLTDIFCKIYKVGDTKTIPCSVNYKLK